MMIRLTDKLSYANIVATIALFVALGGGAYAAVTLPANSVGPRQLRAGAVGTRALGFPLNTVSMTSTKVEQVTKPECGQIVGGAVPPCDVPVIRGGKTSGHEVQITFRKPGVLLTSAIVGLKDEGTQTTLEHVTVELIVDHHFATESELTLVGGQMTQAPIQALVSVPKGAHSVGLRVKTRGTSATGSVFISGMSIVASALPRG